MNDHSHSENSGRVQRLKRRSLLTGAAVGLGGVASAMFLGRGLAQTPSATPGSGSATPSPATPTPNPAYLASPPVEPLQRQILGSSPYLFQAPVDNLRGLLTPNRVHFVRNHYNTPQVDAKTWKLEVQGAVSKPLTLDLTQLQAMPSRTVTAFLECSGNGRAFFQPKTTGAPWTNGGVSVAEWTGVQLSHVLGLAGISPQAVDILSEGSDSGRVFRAIPKVKAMDPDTILAYAQNGEALTYDNGYPVRLLCPGWGGINSIKWIAKITVFDHVFQGFYNDRYYVYETPGLPKTPVQALGVKSFITGPASEASLPAGQPVTVTGFAYSGLGSISKVEVSVDNGQSYQDAQILEPVLRWAWVRWQYVWDKPPSGKATIKSRATDSAGNVQPETVAWNRYGYGNNAIQSRTIQVG